MKIAVVGLGAMGSVYATLFLEAGHEVWAIDEWEEHIDAIKSRGLTLEGASGSRTNYNLNVTTKMSDIGNSDLYIIATKASGVAKAAKWISSVSSSNSLIITIQNGLGAGERISKHMSSNQLILGVAEGFGASIIGPGHAHHNSMKLIRIGELTGGITDRLLFLEKIWHEAGFKVKAFEDITQLIWEKFICNVTFSAPCTVFNKTIGELMEDPCLWEIALGGTKEAFRIAKVKQINLSFEDPVAYVTAFGSNMLNARPSMLLDHMNFRPSEVNAINEMVSIMGREVNISTPYSDTLVATVKCREDSFERT